MTDVAAAPVTEEPVMKNSSSGYWSEGAENLKGTLSSLSLTGLGKRQTESSTSTEPAAPKTGGYWEWEEKIKKTLSTVSLGNLGKKEHNEKTHGDADDEVRPEPKKNYWTWRNSFKSKSDLEGAAAEDGRPASPPPAAGQGYWFWRNSSASLDKAGEEEVELDENGEPKVKSGPISNLEHKLRSTWRKSFQNLSSNSLTKLNEGEASSDHPTGWKENFRSFRESFHNMKVSGSSAKIDEDAAGAGVTDTNLDMSEMLEDGNSSQDGITF